MTLTQLRYFLTLTEHLNFTRAANALFISQTTLSQHISKMEEELQTALFLRNRSGLVLTPEGQYLKNMALMVITEVDALPEALKDIRSLSAVPAIPKTFVVAIDTVAFSQDRMLTSKFISALESLREAYPKTEFIVHCFRQDDILQALLDKSIDVAVGLIKLPPYHKLQARELKRQPMNLMLKYQPQWEEKIPDFEDIKNALNTMDIYTVNFSSSHNLEIKKWLEENGCQRELQYVESSWQLQMKLMLENIVVFIPPHNVSPEFDLLNFYTISISEMSLPRFLAWNTENNHPLIDNFVKKIL